MCFSVLLLARFYAFDVICLFFKSVFKAKRFKTEISVSVETVQEEMVICILVI